MLLHWHQLTYHFGVQVTVVGQVLPVQMTIRMQLTSTHISFRPRSIDFGQCNLGENTGVKVQVTNHSLLPQKYGESGSGTFWDPKSCVHGDHASGLSLLSVNIMQACRE